MIAVIAIIFGYSFIGILMYKVWEVLSDKEIFNFPDDDDSAFAFGTCLFWPITIWIILAAALVKYIIWFYKKKEKK